MTEEGKKKLKRILKLVLRDIGIATVVVLTVTVLNLIFGKSCPMQLFLNFDCPFCGMTRAHLAALRLDFAAAFEYHPLFFLGLPYLFLLFHEEQFRGRFKKPYNICIISLTALFLLRYVLHILFDILQVW